MKIVRKMIPSRARLLAMSGAENKPVASSERESFHVKDKDVSDTKNAVETATPRTPDMEQLSEEDKKKLELSALAEHEHGEAREKLNEQAERS